MKKTLRCTYHYDPLNRLSAVQPERQSNGLRFYCQNRIVTSLHDNTQHSIMHTGDQVLAQQSHEAHDSTSTLLGTDAQRSVLHAVSGTKQQVFAYSPFGHTPAMQAHHLLGFNGERADSITGHYLLGNGYRAFNPVLMRFNSPDSLSPMGAGGINAYAYCMGDPINHVDPSGHIPKSIKWLLRKAGIMKPSVRRKNSLYENGIPKPTDDPKGIKEIVSGQKRKWGRLYPGYSKEQARLADEYHFLNKYMDLIAQRVKKYPDYKVDLDFQLRDNNKKKKLEEDFSKLLPPNHDLTKPAAKASEIRTAR